MCRHRLLITFANSFEPYQARRNVGPDMDPKLFDTMEIFLKELLVNLKQSVVSMIRKYHNHKLQTNPWHREEEPHYILLDATGVSCATAETEDVVNVEQTDQSMSC